MKIKVLLATSVIAAACQASPALAGPATCYTTDDGEYGCQFYAATDGSGSFEITGEGKPWFSLVIESRGVAFGYADYGSGSVALPGMFYRSEEDGACWVNDTTDFEICAW